MKYFTSLLLFLLIATQVMFAQDERGSRSKDVNAITVTEGNTPMGTLGLRFEDRMNGSNTVEALQARGWVVLNVDGGGTTAPFYQGSIAVFNAFEGPDTGYVASNYNGANGFYINHWLISPAIQVLAGDTLYFYHRSPDANPYDDSIYVRLSPNAGITPADFTTTWGRYLTSESGWALWRGTINVTGTIRFAVQYAIWDGGPSGNNSNFIGLDYFRVSGPGEVPVELTSFKANTVGNNVTLNWSTATETNNRGFEIQRKSGSDFVTVGFVSGKGTTTETQNYSYTDKVDQFGAVSYRLKQIDFDGTYAYSSVVETEILKPATFEMAQNYPNPFNPSTNIKFGLAADSKVSLKVFNILGQEVATLVNASMTAGNHTVKFDASSLQSGIYFARIDASGVDGTNFSAIKKMTLTK
ncbi:MAG: T9SS type A sorting domain-containing protein [Ignavibacteriaceae bacterium]|nr:T9SS type A sorting domain-containing protein [Ignavibacteriaceae bacterium]